MTESSASQASRSTLLAGMIGDRDSEVVSVQGLRRNVGQPLPLSSGAVLTVKSNGAWMCRVPAEAADCDAIDSVTYTLQQKGELRDGVLTVGRRQHLPEPSVQVQEASAEEASPATPPVTVQLKVAAAAGDATPIDLVGLVPQAQPDRAAIILEAPPVGHATAHQDGTLVVDLPSGTAGEIPLNCLLEGVDRRAILVEITLDVQRRIEVRDTLHARPPAVDAGVIARRIRATDDRLVLKGEALPSTQVACELINDATQSSTARGVADETGCWAISFGGLVAGQEYDLRLTDINGIAATYGGLRFNEHQLQGATILD